MNLMAMTYPALEHEALDFLIMFLILVKHEI